MEIGFGLLGVFVGFASGFFGIGGGTLLVPIFLYMGYDIKTAIGISVMQMIFSSMLGSYQNYKAGMLTLKSGLILGCGALVGASFSGLIVDTLSHTALLFLFEAVLALSMYKMFTTALESSKPPCESYLLLAFLGVVLGAVSISTGTSGAIFLTPVLTGFLHWDIKKAVATTLFFVIFGSISGFFSLAMHGYVDYEVGALVSVGSIVGVYFGVMLSHKMAKKEQKLALLILYTVMFLLTLNKILSEMNVL
ncbi:sulfite exporter TauE/SafE family protein [Sulfurospirillum cavolei]|uniref:sulfite exporter TauE/SafE family protein n=1 Tax=Sulfurospirillum cavolei TaxID=366522 RepID=UPI000764CE77|nr:sulfite exporter TauE/SafE family protein [Sulfurospirillum cavolei]